jgi:hypothetical protein
MAYTLNAVNITTYGLVPGHAPGSNIAMSGIFDLPKRLGQCFYEWAESNIEPWVDADEMFFAGRDIAFHGSIIGNSKQVNDFLTTLYNAVEAFTDLVVLSTPYGDFNVQVRTIIPEYFPGACRVVINFHEPVVTLTGGSIPGVAADNYMIDGIPFLSWGLYYSKGSGMGDLADLKEQLFTKYGSEGYQMSKRKYRTFDINGFIMGADLTDFLTKTQNLRLIFSSSGMRLITINNEIIINCFAVDGFKIENVFLSKISYYPWYSTMIANFKINMICTNVSYLTADNTLITADDTTITVDGT